MVHDRTPGPIRSHPPAHCRNAGRRRADLWRDRGPFQTVAARHLPAPQDTERGAAGPCARRQTEAHLLNRSGRRDGDFRLGGPDQGVLESQAGCTGSRAGLKQRNGGPSKKQERHAMSRGEIISEGAVRFIRGYDAPVAKVWTFLTDSRLLPEWYGEGQIEPREGGKVSLMAGHIRGVITGWRPEKFLGYTWSVFQPGEAVSAWPISYLEMALDPVGAGTKLTLTHRPIPEAMHKLTMIGWHTMLDMIADGLAGRFPPRAEVMPRNAALYGVDLDALKR